MSYKILCHWSLNRSFFAKWKHHCLWFIIAAYSISNLNLYWRQRHIRLSAVCITHVPVMLLFKSSKHIWLEFYFYHWIVDYIIWTYVITSIYIFMSTAFLLFNYFFFLEIQLCSYHIKYGKTKSQSNQLKDLKVFKIGLKMFFSSVQFIKYQDKTKTLW